MLSDNWKNAFKMASEDPQKIIASDLQGLNYLPYQLFEATFW